VTCPHKWKSQTQLLHPSFDCAIEVKGEGEGLMGLFCLGGRKKVKKKITQKRKGEERGYELVATPTNLKERKHGGERKDRIVKVGEKRAGHIRLQKKREGEEEGKNARGNTSCEGIKTGKHGRRSKIKGKGSPSGRSRNVRTAAKARRGKEHRNLKLPLNHEGRGKKRKAG